MHDAAYLKFKNRPYFIQVVTVVEGASLVSIAGLLFMDVPYPAVVSAFILNFTMQNILTDWKIKATTTAIALLAGSFYSSHPEELKKLTEWKPKEL